MKPGDNILIEAQFYFAAMTRGNRSMLRSYVPAAKRDSLDKALAALGAKYNLLSQMTPRAHLSNYPLVETIALAEESASIWNTHMADTELLKSMWPTFARSDDIALRLRTLNAPLLADLAAQPIQPYLSQARKLPPPPAP